MRVTPLAIETSGVCLVSLSNNSDHQNTLYSMFNALYGRYDVASIGAKNPRVSNAPRTPHNYYVNCPVRPGITLDSFNIKALLNVVQIIKRTGFKTIYFESVHLWNCLIMLMLGKEYVCIATLHDVVPHDGARSVFLCQQLQSMLSDYTVIKSERFRQKTIDLYHIPSKKIIVFEVWRDFPLYSEPLAKSNFLFFGRLRRYKGLENMKRIAELCPAVEFVLAGSPDKASIPMVRSIRESCSNVKIIDREVTEYEMEKIFRASSWVLLPYESASQSGVLIDAYKYGKPVIAFDVGAIGSQIVNGKTGFVIAPGDLDEFARRVKLACAMDADEYAIFSRASYEYGKDRYSAQAVSDLFAELLRVRASDKMRGAE